MIISRVQRTIRLLIATMAIAAVVVILPAAARVDAAGIRNCVDVTGHAAARVACFEDVWVDDAQLKVTFFAGGTAFRGATPDDQLTDFYVLAAQTDTPQAAFPFVHDHILGNLPRQNDGDYSVHLHGFFVFCSAEGIASERCLPGQTPTPFGWPFAKTVNGQPLTSTDAIESAADAGLITLFDTGAVLIGTIGPGQ